MLLEGFCHLLVKVCTTLIAEPRTNTVIVNAPSPNCQNETSWRQVETSTSSLYENGREWNTSGRSP
jgi:hypothetical protein